MTSVTKKLKALSFAYCGAETEFRIEIGAVF